MTKANTNRMYQDVLFLTELRPFRNYLNLESLDKVIQYLHQQIDPLGFDCEEQTWEADGNMYTNLIYTYQPEKTKRLIIGAHYDVCGDQPGADDNGSAVAGLLETIRLVHENELTLDYGIDFVFYCLEEPPFYATELMGSYIHAESVAHNKDNIIGMVCYEMIGYFSDEPKSQGFPVPVLELLYPSVGNYIMTVGIPDYTDFNKKVFEGMKADSEIDVYHFEHELGRSLAGMSDQRSYWIFDIPALMINDTSFLRNPNYHEMSDDIDTLNFDKMAQVIDSMIRCLGRLG